MEHNPSEVRKTFDKNIYMYMYYHGMCIGYDFFLEDEK